MSAHHRRLSRGRAALALILSLTLVPPLAAVSTPARAQDAKFPERPVHLVVPFSAGSQVDVIAPVPGDPGATPTERFITLTTCHPMFSARERFIVHGTLDYWAPVTDGTPAELLGTA